MKFEDIRITSSQKSCAIFTEVHFPIANVLATPRKEFPVAKRQSVAQHIFLLVSLSTNLCLIFLNFVKEEQPVFQNLHHLYENLASTWFEIH